MPCFNVKKHMFETIIDTNMTLFLRNWKGGRRVLLVFARRWSCLMTWWLLHLRPSRKPRRVPPLSLSLSLLLSTVGLAPILKRSPLTWGGERRKRRGEGNTRERGANKEEARTISYRGKDIPTLFQHTSKEFNMRCLLLLLLLLLLLFSSSPHLGGRLNAAAVLCVRQWVMTTAFMYSPFTTWNVCEEKRVAYFEFAA